MGKGLRDILVPGRGGEGKIARLPPRMSTRRISHPLSDELSKYSTGDRTMSNLLPVLGPPQTPLDFNVEDRLRHEMWPVQKIYEGKNVYLEQALSTMIKRTHNPFVTDRILKLRQYPDMNFRWSKWNTDRTLAPQTASQAPPEYVTSSRESHSGTMNRYALGFIVNTEILDTEEGQLTVALDVTNVAMSIADTMEQVGLLALLQRKNHYREHLRKFGEPVGNVTDLFAWEKLFWDIFRKDPEGKGFYIAKEEVKKVMREYIASDVIVPEGVRSLLSTPTAIW